MTTALLTLHALVAYKITKSVNYIIYSLATQEPQKQHIYQQFNFPE